MANSNSYYLVGITGIGMSALAQLIRSSGGRVRGSDLNPEPKISQLLESQGIRVYRGHSRGRIDPRDTVVYSTAIKESNLELQESKQMGVSILHRMEALKKFLEGKKIISITGTHGKTTTTYMLAQSLRGAGVEVGMLLGGISNETGSNFIPAETAYIIELDESDGSFLELESKIKVVTSLDLDHLEFHQDKFSVLAEKFKDFLKKEGTNIVCWDDFNLRRLIMENRIDCISYGFQQEASYRAEILEVGEFGTRYRLLRDGSFLTEVELPLLGYKTALNSLSLFALADILELDLLNISEALQGLKGVERRYQLRLSSSKFKIIEDYAHHPREIEEAISTMRSYLKPERVVVIFQPHRYTRTRYLWKEFKTCFREADVLILTDIYSAFEEEISSINSQNLAQEVEGVESIYSPMEKIPEVLLKLLREGDIILILGAGDINKLSQFLLEKLK